MRTLLTGLLGLVIATTATALADQVNYPTKIINVTNAPLTITSCRFSTGAPFAGEQLLAVALTNRTRYDLLNFVVRIFYYDSAGAPMGSADVNRDVQPALTSHDANSYTFEDPNGMNEPMTALAHVSCRIESATFTGHKAWTYGRPWRG